MATGTDEIVKRVLSKKNGTSIVEYEDKIRILTEALKWYATRENWIQRGTFKKYSRAENDHGKLAEQALKNAGID